TRPRSFGQPSVPVNQIIEESRLPWLYRPGGPMMVPPDAQMPYPRIISHRGFNTIAPENSLPAFAAALSLGAHEIELDVWPTSDGELLVCHDPTINRTSDGKGEISSLSRTMIEGLDAGSWFSKKFSGLRFAFLEDILRAFAGMVIFNIHVKSPAGAKSYDYTIMKKLIQTIDQYQCRDHAYIAGDQAVLEAARSVDPEITRCFLAGQDNSQITDLAILYGCRKLHFFKPHFNHALISKAHEHGIKCNLFWSDEHDEARGFLDQDIDALLVNDLLRVMPLFQQ
ncbi:MAG: glycerophosphodiester phosphodiesterase family protein, partial [Bacillota bacterium]|nr:glycerophosphodiester phosphodiesterase family protein [Bacillota bacterium]